jgi:hypothetical protein
MPKIEEYPCNTEGTSGADGSPVLLKNAAISWMKKENFSTTNPNAMIPRFVRIHAKNVLSLAKWSRRLALVEFFVISSINPL